MASSTAEPESAAACYFPDIAPITISAARDVTLAAPISSRPLTELPAMRATTRPQLLIAALLLLVTAVACGSSEKARTGEVTPADVIAGAAQAFDHFQSTGSQFSIDFPPEWRGNYTVAEHADSTAGARQAVEFTYRPGKGSTVMPKTLLVVRTFSVAAWRKIEARPGTPIAARVAEKGDVVFAFSVPAANPYPAGSADAKTFDQMILAVVNDPAGLRLTPR